MAVRYGLMGWFMMNFQRFIMLNRKLYILITYMILPPAPWAADGRTAYVWLNVLVFF